MKNFEGDVSPDLVTFGPEVLPVGQGEFKQLTPDMTEKKIGTLGVETCTLVVFHQPEIHAVLAHLNSPVNAVSPDYSSFRKFNTLLAELTRSDGGERAEMYVGGMTTLQPEINSEDTNFLNYSQIIDRKVVVDQLATTVPGADIAEDWLKPNQKIKAVTFAPACGKLELVKARLAPIVLETD